MLCVSSLLSSCKKNTDKIPASLSSETNIDADTIIDQKSEYFNMNDFQQLVEDYEDPDRSQWQNPDLVIQKLGDIKGKTIADIGAGTGYFTFRLAEKKAKVVAIDIEERFLEYIDDRKEELNDIIPDNMIETRLSLEDDPLLAKNEVDIALMVNTYYFIKDKTDYLKLIKQGMNENGKLIIVDYKQGDMPFGPPVSIKVSDDSIINELVQTGFKNIDVDTTSLEYQYIITAN